MKSKLTLKSLLKEKCVVDFLGTVDYFLGVRFDWNTTDKSNISCKLVQQAYIESLIHKMDLTDCRVEPNMTPYRSGLLIDSLPKASPDISPATQEKLTSIYRSYIGMLTWITTSTRPDIASAVSFLSTYQSCPTQAHIDFAKYVARYLNSTMSLGLLFDQEEANSDFEGYTHFPIDPFVPTAFCDANWGPQDASSPTDKNSRVISLEETQSMCGFILFMRGTPIMWKCFKEKRSSRSSCEAEIKAADECVRSTQFFRNVLTDIDIDLSACPYKVYCDNRGAIDWAHSMSTKRMRHFNIRENCVREAIFHNKILFLHVAGALNSADIVSKEHTADGIYRNIRDLIVK